ncbi:MAG TPA: hypothetical protein VH436_18945 [Vicinamibacterales bacterium]
MFEAVEVLISLRQDQRRTPVANGVDNVLADSPSTSCVLDQLLIERLEFDTLVLIGVPRRLEARWLNQHEMLERPRRRLCARTHLMPNWAALHEDDRMVTVLACDGCRQADNKSSFSLACHLFATVRRQVVAFVDDHMAVLGDTVIDDTLADETLNDGDVNPSGRSISSAADPTD